MATAAGKTSFLANSDINTGLRVKYIPGHKCDVCGAADQEIGISNPQKTKAYAGTSCGVDLINEPGTRYVTLSGPVNDGDPVFRGALGTVTNAGPGTQYGIALEAGVAGDIIEVMPLL